MTARTPRPMRPLRGSRRPAQLGQAMVEYAIVAAVMVTALLIVQMPEGKTMAQALADGVRDFFRALTFYVSLP